MRLRRVIVPVVAAAVGAGCASSDTPSRADEPTTPGGAAGTSSVEASVTLASKVPTKKEYLRSADEICARAAATALKLRERSEALRGVPEPELSEKLALVFDDQAEFTEDFHKELAELGAPEGDREFIREFLELARSGAEAAREIAASLRARDEGAVDRAVRKLRLLDREATAEAERYGFKECG